MATKRKSPKRVAAGKKAARTRKRTMNAAPVRRRKRRVTKKKGLAAAFTSPKAKAAMKGMTRGALGGSLYYMYDEKVTIPNETPEMRGLLALGGAYLISASMDQPDVAAGVVGAAAFAYMQEKEFLNDGMEETDFINQLPATLDADNMNLADPMSLAAPSYMPGYANEY